MSAFTEDFQRRLRAVLAKHVGAEIPDDVPVTMEARGTTYEIDNGHVDFEIEIKTTEYPFAAFSYEEPGAWGKLLADLDAAEEPRSPLSRQESALLVTLNDQGGQRLDDDYTHPQSVLAERGLVQPHGGYWYITPKGREVAAEIKAANAPATPPLAFVRARRMALAMSNWWAWDELGNQYHLRFQHGKGSVHAYVGPDKPYALVREFEQGTSSAITLAAFAQYAGIDVSQIPEDQLR